MSDEPASQCEEDGLECDWTPILIRTPECPHNVVCRRCGATGVKVQAKRASDIFGKSADDGETLMGHAMVKNWEEGG